MKLIVFLQDIFSKRKKGSEDIDTDKRETNKTEEEEEEEAKEISIRTNFNALAKFAPSVLTDRFGMAQFDFEVPHNLTRYRYLFLF